MKPVKPESEMLSRDLLFWLSYAYVVAIGPQLFFQPASVSVVAFFALAVRWFFEVRGVRHLHWGWRTALCVLMAGQALFFQQSLLGRDGGTTLMFGLMGVKLLESTTLRDYRVLLAVACFLIVDTFLYAQSLLVSFGLAGSFGVVAVALARPQYARDQRVVFLRTTGLLLLSLPVAAVLFILFPRPSFQWGVDLGVARTGLSRELSSGAITRLTSSDAPAFRAEFPDGNAPTSGEMYWRAFVLYKFDGVKWTAKADHLARRQIKVKPLDPSERTCRQRLTIQPHDETWLFALDHPVTQPEQEAKLHEGNYLESPMPVRRKRQYEVVSAWGGTLTGLSPSVRALSLELPAQIDPRLRSLATSWQETPLNTAERLRQIGGWMLGQNLEYTLTPRRLPGDPTAAFLFETRQGFCEDFASAFVVLMRLCGVPGRMVLGYLGGEYNPLTGFWTIRQYHAHAWAEIWNEETSTWQRVDPTLFTPLTNRERGAAAQSSVGPEAIRRLALEQRDWTRHLPMWMRTMGQEILWRWQRVDAAWDEWILGYDAGAQDILLSRFHLEQWRFPFLLGCSILAIILWGGALAWFLLRKPQREDPEEIDYRQWCAQFASVGLIRLPWEGPLEFSRRAATTWPDLTEKFLTWGRAYAQWRYGVSQPTTPYWSASKDLKAQWKQRNQSPMKRMSGAK